MKLTERHEELSGIKISGGIPTSFLVVRGVGYQKRRPLQTAEIQQVSGGKGRGKT